MKATTAYAQARIENLNRQIFSGCLPPVQVVLTHARTFVGKFEYRKQGMWGQGSITDCRMRLSTSFDLTADELDDVIIHELIHCFIACKGVRDTSAHGREFRRIMDGINTAYGRHVTIRHQPRPGQLQTPVRRERLNYLCISILQDDSWGITSCAVTCIFAMHRALPKYFAVKEQRWYCTSDPFFHQLPRSRTPRMYRMDRQEIEQHLAGAQRMEFHGRTFEPAR